MRALILLLIASAPAWAQFGNATAIYGKPICSGFAPTDQQALIYSADSACWNAASSPIDPTANEAITGYWDFSAGTVRMPETTVSALPSAASSTGLIFFVTDGTSPWDCTAGGGSTRALCFSNGSAWTPTGGKGTDYAVTTYSATPTFTIGSQRIQAFKITLTGNVTSSTFGGLTPQAGQILNFLVCQDGTGSRTFTYPAGTVRTAYIDPTASACTSQSFRYNGTAFEGVTPGFSDAPTPGICNSSGCWTLPATPQAIGVHTIDFWWDGGGSAISSGQNKAHPSAFWSCSIYRVTFDGSPSGSGSVEISKKNAALPADGPTSADKISASAPIALSSATYGTSTTLTGWTTAVSSGDVFGAYISGITALTFAHVQIECK